MSRKLLFIVNPRSGKKNSDRVIDIIKQSMPADLAYDIALWTNLPEFNSIALKLKQENYTDAVAVGGDGSVNLTGRTVFNTGITLGIIPTGSGNGLARSLGYPMKTEEALQQIVKGKTALMDVGFVNNIPFFCTSGVGFDAHIGNLFASAVKRGFKSYVKMILRELRTYKPHDYILKIDGKEIKRKAFLITIANAGQYGNNFYIAPHAKLNDGLFHVVVLKPFNFLQGLGIVLKVLRRKADKSRFVETFTCKELSITRSANDSIHFDGEPETEGLELIYTLKPLALKAIVGETFDGK